MSMDKRTARCTILGVDGSENGRILKFEVCCQFFLLIFGYLLQTEKKMLKTIIKKAILKFLSVSDKLARFPPKWASSKFLLKIPNVLDQNE